MYRVGPSVGPRGGVCVGEQDRNTVRHLSASHEVAKRDKREQVAVGEVGEALGVRE